ncbi:hypothetical protein ACVMIL_002687 [Bradyrhizobium barranii subsp. barranii]
MSDGIKSGVNWMRLASRPSVTPSVSTSVGLGEAGHADQQRMAAGEDGDERVLDHPILAKDDGPDCVFRRADLARHLLGRTDDSVFQFLDTFRHPSAP